MKKVKSSLKLKSTYNHAITLISLVITIIILLILASIAINIALGENGIFKRAKDARDKYLVATEEEQKALNELYNQLQIEEDLPENTPNTTIGTKVKLPEKWTTITPIGIQTVDGKEVISSRKVSSVYAVALGDGITLPVPHGFYYVGGNLETGVVISDNENDKNKYINNNIVPSGVTVQEVQKEGVKKLEFVDELKGNQFVWIPCIKSEYHKSNWANGKQGNIAGISDCYWETQTSITELIQIEKYGGFYVARYEAGLPTEQDGFIGENGFTSVLASLTNWSENNFSYNSVKTPISKAGREPWNFIDYDNSLESAKKMYNTNSVKSGLITDTQWDVMLNKIVNADSTKSLTNSESWGNYWNNEFTYTGKAAEMANSKIRGYGMIEQNVKKEKEKVMLLTTGATERNKAYNLYDVAGNVWEWTEQSVTYNSIENLSVNRMMRGGAIIDGGNVLPAIYRQGMNSKTQKAMQFGFRVVLYIM